MSAPEGLLVVDKPAGWTSHDVVARVRRLAGTRRVGHAGTLDPMATGVLVLGIGRATKLLTFLVGCDKVYAATVRLGESTVTDDAEGELTAAADASGVIPAAVGAAVAELTGLIEQVPSAVSAIKVGGKRSYARVRGGEDVTLAARPVTVHRFDVLAIRRDVGRRHPVLDVDIEVEVSSGTYVRALARDLGAALGVGGHLTALRRTGVGGFAIDAAHDLHELTRRQEQAREQAEPALGIPLIELAAAARAALPTRELSADEARAASHGQPLASARPGRTEPVAAFAPDGALIAILDESARRARTHVVFTPGGS